MKYSVDQIIDNIAVLENIDNNEKTHVNIEYLPDNIHEGSILRYEDSNYILDEEEEKDRKESFRERLERLKRLNN